jgi:hypothetical protein
MKNKVMTPKEKAQELILKLNQLPKEGLSEWFLSYQLAKHSAIIIVDEIIDAIDWHEFEHPNKEFDYWYEVKQEIEML